MIRGDVALGECLQRHVNMHDRMIPGLAIKEDRIRVTMPL